MTRLTLFECTSKPHLLALLVACALLLTGCCKPSLPFSKGAAADAGDTEDESGNTWNVEPIRYKGDNDGPAPSQKKSTSLKGATWTRLELPGRLSQTHVLDIDGEGDNLAVATFGQGLFVSVDKGKTWRRLRGGEAKGSSKVPGRAMGSNYLSGVDVVGSSLWVRSIGHGFGQTKINRASWRWFSGPQLDKEFLFPTDLWAGEQLTIATADGLWQTRDDGRNFEKKGKEDGLPSEYVLSYASFGDDAPEGLKGVWVGLLTGLVHTPPSGRTRTITVDKGLPSNRINGIHRFGDKLLVRTDKGLAFSDAGARWRRVTTDQGLPDGHVYDLADAGGDKVWAGTADGLAQVNLGRGAVSAVFRQGADPRRNQINAVHVDTDGRLLAGSSDGLWVVEPSTEAVDAPEAGPCEPDSTLKQSDHPQWPRPIGRRFNQYVDQTYMFGQTWGGQFGVHKGFEFNNAEGTSVLAVAPGEVVYARVGMGTANVVVVRHDEKYADLFVYSLYVHLSTIGVKLGDRVKVGAPVGTVGHTGAATNDHLHFEVRMSKSEGDGMSEAGSHNPALFLKPLRRRGVIAGRVRQKGKRVSGAQIFGPIVPEPDENPFGFYEAYGKGAQADPVLDEDFAILDVPAGIYPTKVTVQGRTVTRCIKVEPGKIAWANFEF